jgi:hypothetical protein
MVFEIDADRPNSPGIARILSILGMLSLIFSVGLLLGAFSQFAWINTTYAFGGAAGAFMFAVVMIGQAKTLELLAVVSARVKSRFALEGMMRSQAPAAPADAAPKLPMATPGAKPDRVISIPESVAREQGLTRKPEPRDFG